MATSSFANDVRQFTEALQGNISKVLAGTATRLHGRLGDVTPYRSGRARASWNLSQGYAPDLSVPPQLPGNMLGSTIEEVLAARAFYNPIFDAMHAYRFTPDVNLITMANSVDYIELLNNGWSSQAPAAFFELTLTLFDVYVAEEVSKLGRP